MTESKKTFWPYGILLSILAIVIACIVTIIIASYHPVYEDDFYFDTYQNVENNYNAIQKRQEEFDKLFKVEFQNNRIVLLGERLLIAYIVDLSSYVAQFKITPKEMVTVENLESEILLTRPHTAQFDQELQAYIRDDFLEIPLPELQRGRWQLKLKLTINDTITGFFIYELNAQNET